MIKPKSKARMLKNMHPVVLSNRARRRARKAFSRHKQDAKLGKLLYRMNSSIDPTPEPTDKLKREWEYLDARSQEMYKKKYDNLTAKQQHALIDSMHKES